MPHRLKALVSLQKINEQKANELELKYFYEEGAVIIPLGGTHLQKWAKKLDFGETINPLTSYDTKITHHLAKEIGLTHYAYIETKYHAGQGTQRAHVYENNKTTAFFTTINHALKLLGIQKKDGMDEFDTIDLRKYRNGERYYW